MSYLLSLFILVPLITFFVSLIYANKQEKSIFFIVQITTVGYIIGAIALAVMWAINDFAAINEKLVTLYKTEDFVFALQFYYDGLTAVYSVVGALIFFLVAIFSRYYMHRDEGFKRFFNTLLFFLTGYNLIIFSGNFETLFMGWEMIGLSSFLLIAFYRNRYLPVKNGLKVISVYRVSDVALILAMWMMHHLTHQNIAFTQLAEAKATAIQYQHSDMALFIAIMVVLAAVAKSAQLPFTSWLPRAMEGPTSSSAIFYGSLSIHIGVFLLLRTYPFWENILWIKVAIAFIGALTGIIATFIARVQPTVKTQIAYASAAQIGIIFIEVALGFHVLALVHFAGNAFLRTYQLLVSPSVLNYLIHHQYFHYKPNSATGNNKWVNTVYTLSVKEWNIDSFLYQYLWMPFKYVGRGLKFLETTKGKIAAFILLGTLIILLGGNIFFDTSREYFALLAIAVALLLILYSFTSRGSALTAWMYLLLAHVFILFGIISNMEEVKWEQVIMYASGVLLAAIVGFISLQKIFSIDRNISLNQFHGYVYEQKGTALLFLLAAIGLLGFPITAAFIGVDVFFTHIDANQAVLITLTALCFLFIELAAIRIYCRIFLGLHKKLYHPIAFRSS
jgi:NADH:ubiquinone oxidoreductase subunit 5 (subunit L)/multisubunit Na+/H+ antiporter MnhA subunit